MLSGHTFRFAAVFFVFRSRLQLTRHNNMDNITLRKLRCVNHVWVHCSFCEVMFLWQNFHLWKKFVRPLQQILTANTCI